MTPAPADLAATLPFPSIVRELLAAYYRDDGPETGASSHWRHYAGQFHVVQGDDHALVSLSGTAFGNAKWRSTLHRLADDATIALHLATLPRRRRLRAEYRRLKRVTAAMGLHPTFDAFRQCCSLELLDRTWSAAAPPRVVVIGDGHGVLSALIKDRWPDASVTLIDLGRTLLFQTVNCQRGAPESRHVLAGAGSLLENAFIYCPADRLDAIGHLRFDIAINIASMQEMTPETVAGYFALLRRQLMSESYFYCCNRERKVLPGGEVSVLAEYPWRADDRVHLDEPCPWHQYFLTPLPPFLRHYDGRHRHRLVTLLTEPRQ